MRLRTKRRLDAVCVLAIVLVFALAGGLTWLARERELAASRAVTFLSGSIDWPLSIRCRPVSSISQEERTCNSESTT